MQPLSEIDKSRENSITFLRLLAACAVIYGHSFAVVPGFGADWVVKLTNYAHAGGVAVGFFFILSGYLVCGSILKRGAIRYISARLLRMLPALWFFTITMVFVIGALLTSQEINDYFSAAQTWLYFINSSFLIESEWFLPGAFEDQHNKVVGAMAYGVPLITSPVGIQGLAGAEQIIPVASEPHALANAVCSVFTSDERWCAYSCDGNTYIAERYSLSAMTATLVQFLWI